MNQPDRRRWAVLAVLCIAVLVVNVDSTILNVALPTLVRKLHATSSELQWIVDVYAMVFAGLLLVAGSLADRVGRKRLFIAGLAVFAVGSLGAAFSGSVNLLIAWRGLMGAGAAMMIPAGLSILDNVFRDPNERAKAVGIWGGAMGVGLAIGPLAGGLLLSWFWWGSVFFVNVPVVLLGGLAAIWLVPESKNRAAPRSDPGGALLSMLGLGLLLWAIIEAPTRGWGSASVLAVGICGLVAIGAFVAWEARSTHPMLKLSFFRSRRFSVAVIGVALGLFALFGAVFVLTQFLQFDLGLSPLQAGVRILPTAAVLAAAAPLSTLVVRAIGSKLTAAAGLAAITGGLWMISAASTVSATYADVLPGMLLLGFGAGLLMPTAADSVLGSLPRRDAGVGSATYVVAIQVGGALGVAVIGSMLNARYQDRLTEMLAGHQVPAGVFDTITGSIGGALGVASAVGGPTGALLAAGARSAFMNGAHLSVGVGAIVAGVATLIVLAALPSRAPSAAEAHETTEPPPAVPAPREAPEHALTPT